MNVHLRRLRVAGERDRLGQAIFAIGHRTWDPMYDGDAAAIARFFAARVEGVLTGAGRVSPDECELDCHVSFGRVMIDDVVRTNPERLLRVRAGGFPQLAERLRADASYDGVAIACARSTSGHILWDGHHRYVTYLHAKRESIPSWIATFRKGSGEILLSSS